MRPTLIDDLDLRPTLDALRKVGAVFIERALDVAFLDQVVREVRDVPFERMPAEEGRAQQGGERFRIVDRSAQAYPSLTRLGSDLAERVRQDGLTIPGCTSWRPNDVLVQRYGVGDLGITPHLDLKRYRCLVAVFTLEGAARFTICKNRDGDPEATWTAAAGSLILLRAPGFDGHENGRPLHSVSGPAIGRRISLSYRMDSTRSDDPLSD